LKIVNILKMKLRRTHWEQLESYLLWAEGSEMYYGNKQQFKKRHIELKEWLEEVLKENKLT